jgi:hypothetical protein
MDHTTCQELPGLSDAGQHPAGPSNPSDVQADPELAGLVPPPTKDERARLEASLLEEGCRSPLAVWKGRNVLLDGHERLALCRRYGLPFRTVEIPLPDRDAARRWVVANQLARRNLAPEAVIYLRGKLYEATRHQGRRTDRTCGQNVHKSGSTARQMAADQGVDEKTIRRNAGFARAVDAIAGNCGEEAKHAILSGRSGLTRKRVEEIARMDPPRQLAEVRAALAEDKPAAPGDWAAAGVGEAPGAGGAAAAPCEEGRHAPAPRGYAEVLPRLSRARGLLDRCARDLSRLPAGVRLTVEQVRKAEGEVRGIIDLAERLLARLAAGPAADVRAEETDTGGVAASPGRDVDAGASRD